MQRDPSAYLNDIIEAAAAIQAATDGLNSETYGQSRLIRSSVEREFIIIGEAPGTRALPRLGLSQQSVPTLTGLWRGTTQPRLPNRITT